MSSSVPAARDWLYQQLQALTTTTLERVLIRNTGQFDDTTSMEQIILQLPDTVAREWLGISRQLHETYTLPVFVSVRSHATDLQATEDRFWTVIGVIENLVVSGEGAHLGGTVSIVTPAGVSSLEAGPVAGGGNTGGPVDVLCQGTLEIACEARIQT